MRRDKYSKTIMNKRGGATNHLVIRTPLCTWMIYVGDPSMKGERKLILHKQGGNPRSSNIFSMTSHFKVSRALLKSIEIQALRDIALLLKHNRNSWVSPILSLIIIPFKYMIRLEWVEDLTLVSWVLFNIFLFIVLSLFTFINDKSCSTSWFFDVT